MAIESIASRARRPSRDDAWRWILMSGARASGKLVYIGWLDGDRSPRAVAKVAREDRFNDRVGREQGALVQLHRFLTPDMRRPVPLPLGTGEQHGLVITVESAVRGRPLGTYLHSHRRSAREVFERLRPLGEWVTRLGERSREPASGAELRRLLFDPIDAALRDLALSPDEKDNLRALREMAVELSSRGTLPLVFTHNDLGTPNVTVDDRGRFAGIVDWESSGVGLPAADLIYFLGRFAYEMRGSGYADELRGFKEIFFTTEISAPGALGTAQASEWLGRYCARVGVASSWLPVLFALCWIGHALNEKMQADERRAQEPSLGLWRLPPISSTHFLDHLRFYLTHRERLALHTGERSERGTTG